MKICVVPNHRTAQLFPVIVGVRCVVWFVFVAAATDIGIPWTIKKAVEENEEKRYK
jgi:hypothetical protein